MQVNIKPPISGDDPPPEQVGMLRVSNDEVGFPSWSKDHRFVLPSATFRARASPARSPCAQPATASSAVLRHFARASSVHVKKRGVGPPSLVLPWADSWNATKSA